MAGDHPRNTGPMNTAPRCGARTRRGVPCASPAVSGGVRCRMHGGKGSGAPRGNRNALRHGLYTREVKEKKERSRAFIEQAKMAMKLWEPYDE